MTQHPMPATATFIGAAGNKLVADVFGDSGSPVLLLHGGGQTRHAWHKTAQEIARKGHTAYALDQRGHGDSDWVANGAYEFSDYAADAKAVAAELTRRAGVKPIAIGASLGGIASLLAEGKFECDKGASVFSALVLVDITPRVDLSGVAKVLGFMRANAREGFASIAEAAHVVADYLPQRPRPDTKPVFDIIGERAEKLCNAQVSVVSMVDGELIQLTSIHGVTEEGVEAVRRVYPMRRNNETITARAIRTCAVVHVPDVLGDSQYEAKDAARTAGYRACLGVPMVREGQVIGAIFVARTEPGLFADTQIQLLMTFADQAVIAIENARLFEEVQNRTRELSQSVEELRALGEVSQAVNSTLDLETVLTTIVGRAVQLSRTDTGAIYVFDEERKEFRLHATYGMSETMIAAITGRQIGLGDANIGAATAQRKPIQVPDIRNEPASPVNEIILREGYRSILIIPLLRPDHIVGALVVRRKTPGEFPQSTIDLLQTFADQSVVAIQNARLFENVEARTRELAKSLEDLRTAQDRLVQTEKLASLGQLTAGIAHEIKNPLNFVNNFSAISVELIDELRQALAGANLDNKLRKEISEIADTLQGNLDKVVQHGKRADAIVKNMLLHSRQGSGERRPIDINTLVEESLNLAYHGARAEKQGFNIALESSFDPTAGEVDVFPQEITRVLLNLISNGFYAATKRKAETNGGNYEPTLAAARTSAIAWRSGSATMAPAFRPR